MDKERKEVVVVCETGVEMMLPPPPKGEKEIALVNRGGLLSRIAER